MPQIYLDFSQVQTYEEVPAGQYPAVIDHVELRDNKAGTAQYLNWDNIITEGEYEGRHVFVSTSLQEQALWKLKQFYLNLGVIEADAEGLPIDVDDTTNYLIDPPLAGTPVLLVVTEKIQKGKVVKDVDIQAAQAPVLTKTPGKPVGRPAPAVATRPGQKPGLKLK